MVPGIGLILVSAAAVVGATDAELQRLTKWMTGTFDTFAQVKQDEASNASFQHMRIVARLAPVRVEGLTPGLALYVEQAMAGAEDRPFRQRIHLMDRTPSGQPVTRVYRIRNQDRYVGGTERPGLLQGLGAADLTEEVGCDVKWTKVRDDFYTGIAGAGGTCRTVVRGASTVTSTVELTPDSVTSFEEGFDESGAHVWGPPQGVRGHEYRKR